mmetsp:Transcript_73093/g.156582  ORF Transcript_73093/g.156582 Transcript_73093/m.156582 type:complete len:277 (-) Transcript_73093:180-1010(-)
MRQRSREIRWTRWPRRRWKSSRARRLVTCPWRAVATMRLAASPRRLRALVATPSQRSVSRLQRPLSRASSRRQCRAAIRRLATQQGLTRSGPPLVVTGPARRRHRWSQSPTEGVAPLLQALLVLFLGPSLQVPRRVPGRVASRLVGPLPLLRASSTRSSKRLRRCGPRRAQGATTPPWPLLRSRPPPRSRQCRSPSDLTRCNLSTAMTPRRSTRWGRRTTCTRKPAGWEASILSSTATWPPGLRISGVLCRRRPRIRRICRSQGPPQQAHRTTPVR